MKKTKSLLAVFLACMMVLSCFVITPAVAAETASEVSPAAAEEPAVEWKTGDPCDDWDGTDSDTSWENTKEPITDENGNPITDENGNPKAYRYHITTAEQLANLATRVNGNTSLDNSTSDSTLGLFQSGGYRDEFVLDVNIRLNDTAGFDNWATNTPANNWTPIGDYRINNNKKNIWLAFNGVFDGNGHTIEGMYCNGFGAGSGLFGVVGERVTVKDLRVTKSYVSGTGNGIGIVAGQTGNTHSNETRNPFLNVTVTDSYLKGTTGGTGVILGRTANMTGQTLVFDNCDIENTRVEATTNIGGILGYHGSGALGGFTFKNCNLTNNTLKARASIGGVMGSSEPFAANSPAVITFENCIVNNTIEIDGTTAGNNNGGLVGYLQSPPKSIVIKGCSVGGEIHALQNSGIFIGRIGSSAANADITIDVTGSSSTANLFGDVAREGVSSQALGAVVGYIQTATGTNIANINVDGLNCTGTIDASAKNGSLLGIFGSIDPQVTSLTISNVTSVPDISGAGYIGALIGKVGVVGTANISDVRIGSTLKGTGQVGGLIGQIEKFNELTIADCTVNNTVTSGEVAGGLVGRIGAGAASAQSGKLTIERTNVGGSVEGTYWVAGFVGCTYANPTEISVTGGEISAAITEKTGSKNNHGAGGMFGQFPRAGGNTSAVMNKVTVKDTKITGTVSGGVAGGIFANLTQASVGTLEVSGVTVSENITGRLGAAGGLIGRDTKLTTITIDGTTVSGEIKGRGGFETANNVVTAFSVGGLIGSTVAGKINITNSTVTGKINANSGWSGGFIGRVQKVSDITFDNCYNTGTYTANASRDGGFVGAYAPVEATADNPGSLTFKNIYSTMSMKGSDYVGGLVGMIGTAENTENTRLTVENAVLLGNVETTNSSQYIGAVFGSYPNSRMSTLPGIVTIKNVYYNGMTTGAKLGRITVDTTKVPNAADVYSECLFYTPGTDNTPDVKKQPNAAIVNFLEATKTFVPAPAIEHTPCTPVTMDQKTENDPENPAMITLGCQVPGCVNHKITEDSSIGYCFGASVRLTEPKGLRFGFRMDEKLYNGEGENVSMGVILLPKDFLVDGQELTLDTPKIAKAPAAKVFKKGNEQYKEGTVAFTGVLIGIPTTQYDTQIAARAYVKVGDTVYYSEQVSTSYNNHVQATANAQ